MAKASRKGVASTVAVASNLQLIIRDVALGNLRLKDDHDARARTVPFHGKNLLGPNIKEIDAKIFIMQQQHSLLRGLTVHFKVPKKPAPKAVQGLPGYWLLVHQRLGPPVNLQEGRQSFQNGQQNQQNQNFSNCNSQAESSSARDTNQQEGKPFIPKKKAAWTSKRFLAVMKRSHQRLS